MWYAGDKMILELFNYSRQKLGVEIPLAKEVLHLSSFCWELSTFFNKERDNVKVELQKQQPKKAILKWFHLTFDSSRTETLEVPEDAIWAIRGQCLEILDEKCEELAELCGWYKKHPKV